MGTSVNITKRVRKRKLTTGAVVKQTRWVLNYREPRSGQRRQLFFDKQKDAQARRNQITAEVETGTYSEDRNRTVTIREIVRRWLESRDGEVKDGTLDGYRRAAENIVGPLLLGTAQQRTQRTVTGKQPEGTKTIPLLGDSRSMILLPATSDPGTRFLWPRSAGTRQTVQRCFWGASWRSRPKTSIFVLPRCRPIWGAVGPRPRRPY